MKNILSKKLNIVAVMLVSILFFNVVLSSAFAIGNAPAPLLQDLEDVNEKSLYSLNEDITKQLNDKNKILSESILNNYSINNEPRVYEYENEIWVYYDINSESINSDFSFIQYILDKDSNNIISSFSFITEKDTDFNRIKAYNDIKPIADFKIDEQGNLGEGWVLNLETNEKMNIQDVNPSNAFSSIQNEGISTFGFSWSCIDRCYDNYNIPAWVVDGVNLVITGSCILGPNPVCLSAIAVAAGIYGGKLVGCIRSCWN